MAHINSILPIIVIIEDDPHQARGMQRILADAGYTVETAATGQDGLRLVAETNPDLVLLDVMLPDILGTEVCRQIRESGTLARIILLSSAKIKPEDHANGLKLGADDYISRPFSRMEFMARVHAVLRTHQAEYSLRRSRDQLEKIISSMADGVLVVDHHGTIQFANNAAVAMFGRSSEELIGRPFGHPVISAQYTEVDIYRGDGEVGIAEMRVTNIAWHYVPGWLVTLHDITRRRQIDEQLKRQAVVFEAAPYGMLITDSKGVIEWVNPAFTTLTGYGPHEAIGQHVAVLLADPADTEQTDSSVAGIKANAQWTGLVSSSRKDGSTFTQRLTTAAVKNELDDLTHIIGIMEDMTVQHQAEAREAQEKDFAIALAANTAIITSAMGDIDRTLDLILESVGAFIPHTGANILLTQPDSGMFRIASVCDCYAEHGVPAPRVGQQLNLQEWPIMTSVLNGAGGEIIADVRDHPGWVVDSDLDWIRSYAMAPIRVRNQFIGVLNVDHREPGQYEAEHLRRLQAFADQAAIAISNAQLYEQLENQVTLLETAVQERTHELSEAKERVERTLNNSPDPILLLDVDGVIETANPAFYTTFGYEPREVTGEHFFLLFTSEDHETLSRILTTPFPSRDARRLELVAKRRDQSSFDAEVAISPILRSTTAIGFVCTLHDISESKEIERLKDQFVSNVSHELRTPLTSIKLNHKLLSMAPGEVPRYLERLDRETNRLLNLIDDLLNLSRIDQDRIQLNKATIDLNEIIDTFVRDRTTLVESNQRIIRFLPDPDLKLVEADPRLVDQVLSILLTNAIAYSGADTTIVLATATIHRDNTDWAAFSVIDQGVGIQPDEMENLFDRFYRGWAAQETNVPGTGLGLAIASEIVALHDGMIEVESRADSDAGTTFTVLLPQGSG